MLNGSEDNAQALATMSALADGELDAAGVATACTQWRDQPQARATWHAYLLIGDVMRSDELVSDAQRDSQFLLRLRERLSTEPAVLAPLPVQARSPDPAHVSGPRPVRRSAWSWMAPAAVAAGFVAIAGVLVITGAASPVSDTFSTLAQALGGKPTAPDSMTPPGAEAMAQSAPLNADPQIYFADGKLVRDARLERYFAAHAQFGGSSALGAPSGFLRAATAQAPER